MSKLLDKLEKGEKEKKTIYNCKYCNKKFKSKNKKLSHEKSCKYSPRYSPCPFCSGRYIDLESHIENIHKKTNKVKNETEKIDYSKIRSIFKEEINRKQLDIDRSKANSLFQIIYNSVKNIRKTGKVHDALIELNKILSD